MMNFTVMVYDENSSEADTDSTVRYSVSISVAKPTIEWISLIWEEITNILQSRNLKHLRHSLNNFPFERSD